jgi:UDP-N-acetylmuramyl pentapeptide phosphotransferase/UDP-N-acetylglucosamine-1-phosphate transferase
MFLIGAKDDIDPIAPAKKFIGQLFATGILIFFANIKITSLYGIFAIHEIPQIPSVLLSFFVIILIINAFNLIDGINGLSGSIGILMSITYGTWFLLVDKIELASVSFALVGALLAFLYYNVSPARIFMGDTGSLFIGLTASILTISFMEQNLIIPNSKYAFSSAPAVAVGILILPLFDTLRLFVTRIINKKSPFQGDKNHIHHLLLDIGLSHMQATSVLIFVNMGFIFLVYNLQKVGTLRLMLILFVVASLFTLMVFYIRSLYKSKSQIQNSF